MPVFNVVTNVKLDEPIVFLKELSKVSTYLGLIPLGTDRLKARIRNDRIPRGSHRGQHNVRTQPDLCRQ